MDQSLRKNILLGLFVLGGITLFIIGIFLVGSKNGMFQKSFPVTARFKNATGLKVGSNVRYNGVRVGIVKSVTLLNDTMVQVAMLIEEDKRPFILKDAVAAIASDGLMGDKIVNISAGNAGSQPLSNNDILETHNPINTDQVLATLTQSNENIKVITDNLKVLTTEINTNNGPAQMLYKDTVMAWKLKQSFTNLDAITGKVLTASESLQKVTAQIQNGNGALSEIINDTAFANNLSYTLDRLKQTSDELTRASGTLSQTLQHASSGKGAVNMFLTDTTLSGNVQQSMINIKNASKNLNENMEALKHSFLTRGYFRRQAKKEKQDEGK